MSTYNNVHVEWLEVLQKVTEMSEKQQRILHCLENLTLNVMVSL